jgi:hypothetical protein
MSAIFTLPCWIIKKKLRGKRFSLSLSFSLVKQGLLWMALMPLPLWTTTVVPELEVGKREGKKKQTRSLSVITRKEKGPMNYCKTFHPF